MSDIVERLRSADVFIVKSVSDLFSPVAHEAAAKIAKLRAERDALKTQLAATVPEGTDDMLKAGHAAHYHIGKHAAHVWTAMVETAGKEPPPDHFADLRKMVLPK